MKTIIIVLIFTTIGLMAFGAVENQINAASASVSASIYYSGDNMLTITLSGEVENPGTYYVDLGSTLSDALTKAGGTTSNSDERAYYTSYELEDGMSFYIAPLKDVDDACNNEEISKVNINTADKSSLLDVPGFGDAIATNLISYRESNDAFTRLEDIKNVSGIGDATFSKCKDYIILKGS